MHNKNYFVQEVVILFFFLAIKAQYSRVTGWKMIDKLNDSGRENYGSDPFCGLVLSKRSLER